MIAIEKAFLFSCGWSIVARNVARKPRVETEPENVFQDLYEYGGGTLLVAFVPRYIPSNPGKFSFFSPPWEWEEESFPCPFDRERETILISLWISPVLNHRQMMQFLFYTYNIVNWTETKRNWKYNVFVTKRINLSNLDHNWCNRTCSYPTLPIDPLPRVYDPFDFWNNPAALLYKYNELKEKEYIQSLSKVNYFATECNVSKLRSNLYPR